MHACIVLLIYQFGCFYRLINSYTSEVDYTTFEEICPPHLYDRKQAASLFNALLRKYPREVHKYPKESYMSILESYTSILELRGYPKSYASTLERVTYVS